MLIEGMTVIDIIYGGNIVNLFFWIIFGICGQSIIAILVLGRKPFWADVCWGILRVQLPVFLLIVWYVLTSPFGCLCMMDHGVSVFFELALLTNISLYGIAYFSIMSIAIYYRYKCAVRTSMLGAASVITYLVDLFLTTVLFFMIVS